MYLRALSIFLVFGTLFAISSAQDDKPVVLRPGSTRRYTTVLSMDGGGLRGLISAFVVDEIEASIKRYLLEHPEHLPPDAEIESEADFHVLLADYFDSMSGVSAGSWASGYLASKGGNGAARTVFEDEFIADEYGSILPGEAKGLQVFFKEYGSVIYPGGILFNLTPPAMTLADVNVSEVDLFNPLAVANTAAALLPGVLVPGLNAPFFSAEGLETTLDAFLGDVQLSELSTFYVVHAFDLTRRQTVYFVNDNLREDNVTYTYNGIARNAPRRFSRNSDDDENENYRPDAQVDMHDFHLADLLRGSSAPPGLQAAKILSPVDDENVTFTLIDGASITNNPALQQLIFLASEPHSVPIADIAMISVGTGMAVQDLEGRVNDSTFGWLVNNALLSLSADGNAENVQQQVDFMFYGTPGVRAGQYLRVQTSADISTPSGDALSRFTEPSDLERLERIGRATARRYGDAIDTFVADFIFAE